MEPTAENLDRGHERQSRSIRLRRNKFLGIGLLETRAVELWAGRVAVQGRLTVRGDG